MTELQSKPELTATAWLRAWLIVGSLGLAAAIVFGLIWIFVVSPTLPTGNLGWFLFSFATGLTMIVLPCTLPLAFVIVPLAMGRGMAKGLGMALSFGVGVALTLSLYGVVAALVGGAAIDTLGAPLETVKNWVYFVAGIFALVFALSEIGLLKVRMPSYSGAAPAFIQTRGDFLKAFLLGMFLGNIGVGCPHPATPLLLIEVASSADVLYGWILFLVHAIGRILPLLLLAFLAILGVNGLNWLVARKDKVEKATGWAMVFVAGFILTLGLFTHDWWVNSGIHTQFEKLTQEELFIGILVEQLDSEVAHTHGVEEGSGLFGLPLWLGNWFLVFVWLVPMWWWFVRKRRRVKGILPEKEVNAKEAESKLLSVRGWGLLALSVLLALSFIYWLPHNFLKHEAFEGMHEEMVDEHGDVHSAGEYHEESDVIDGLSVNLFVRPDTPAVLATTTLSFFINEKPEGTPVIDLEIEHEKFIHVIGVRDDLSNFFHIHPERTEMSGVWNIDHHFAVPGVYKLWSDVTVNGATHSFGHVPFSVLGTETVERELPDFLENVIVGEHYQVAFSHDALVVGRNTDIVFTVSDVFGGGVPLEPYLGADMHLAVIKDDLTEYIHTHPGGGDHGHDDFDGHHGSGLISRVYAHGGEVESGIPPTDVSFSVTFPASGTYKLFAQFRPEGIDLPDDESLVAGFFVRVTEETSLFSVFAEDRDASWWQKPLWWALLIVSLLLIAILSLGVRRYLKVE